MTALIACLSPSQRTAARHKAEGHSRTETARAMGVSPAHVKNMWKEARERVRLHMTPQEIAFWDAKFCEGPPTPVRPISLNDVQA